MTVHHLLFGCFVLLLAVTSFQTNSFVLEMETEEAKETLEERKKRSRKELSAVQRTLGMQPKPLPPKVVNASFTHLTTTMFEFTQLFDFRMCPAAPVDKDSYSPEIVHLKSIVGDILPSFPDKDDGAEADLFFPCAKFTNQSSSAALDFIPSMYTEPLSGE